ncbi:MAG: hypothetical protein H5U10_10240 [Desulfacinum sp.]|nr:hypothetical protein [Desulfacinum sp.]
MMERLLRNPAPFWVLVGLVVVAGFAVALYEEQMDTPVLARGREPWRQLRGLLVRVHDARTDWLERQRMLEFLALRAIPAEGPKAADVKDPDVLPVKDADRPEDVGRESSAPKMVPVPPLQGIVCTRGLPRQESCRAVVGGRSVSAGDEVEGYRVLAVAPSHVVLAGSGGMKVRLELRRIPWVGMVQDSEVSPVRGADESVPTQ